MYKFVCIVGRQNWPAGATPRRRMLTSLCTGLSVSKKAPKRTSSPAMPAQRRGAGFQAAGQAPTWLRAGNVAQRVNAHTCKRWLSSGAAAGPGNPWRSRRGHHCASFFIVMPCCFIEHGPSPTHPARGRRGAFGAHPARGVGLRGMCTREPTSPFSFLVAFYRFFMLRFQPSKGHSRHAFAVRADRASVPINRGVPHRQYRAGFA